MDFLKKFFASLFTPNVPAGSKKGDLGALVDTRPPEEKAKDYTFNEIVAAAAVVTWREKKKSEWRQFGVQDQISSSSCVAQSTRKAMRVLFKVNHDLDLDFSAADIYSRRSNKPEEGMAGPDAFAIAKAGVMLNALMPSDGKTESEMNNPKELPGTAPVRAAFQIPGYVTIADLDFEKIASVIQKTGKGVVVFYWFTSKEWGQEKPQIQEAGMRISDSRALHHAVCVVDAFLVNGKKYLLVEDSAHFSGFTYHLISEEFHKARCYYSAYPMRFAFDPIESMKPTYDGTTVSLQNCLKYEGTFPTNIEATGVYGAITTKAVKDFQKKYGLEQVGTVGPATTAKLRELYP